MKKYKPMFTPRRWVKKMIRRYWTPLIHKRRLKTVKNYAFDEVLLNNCNNSTLVYVVNDKHGVLRYRWEIGVKIEPTFPPDLVVRWNNSKIKSPDHEQDKEISQPNSDS